MHGSLPWIAGLGQMSPRIGIPQSRPRSARPRHRISHAGPGGPHLGDAAQRILHRAQSGSEPAFGCSLVMPMRTCFAGEAPARADDDGFPE